MPVAGSRTVFDGVEKQCRECQQMKPIGDFQMRADGKATRPRCRKCLVARANASDAGRAARFKWELRTKYGMSPDDFAERLAAQNGRCAIRQRLPPPPTVRLYVDHCHETGMVRGLLCINCNGGLGQFGDDVYVITAALEYLLKNGGA